MSLCSILFLSGDFDVFVLDDDVEATLVLEERSLAAGRQIRSAHKLRPRRTAKASQQRHATCATSCFAIFSARLDCQRELDTFMAFMQPRRAMEANGIPVSSYPSRWLCSSTMQHGQSGVPQLNGRPNEGATASRTRGKVMYK